MNAQPAREGFVVVEDQPLAPPVVATPAPPGVKRAAPPPTIEPSPAELPPLPASEWPITVTLRHKAIRNNTGAEVKQLTMREPRAGDINRYGNPVRVNSDGEIIIDERKMTLHDRGACQHPAAVHRGNGHPRLEQLRVSDSRFFSARAGRLVGDEDEVILFCYRLAKHYHVSPEVFLSMPVDEVLMHLHRTAQMEAELRSGDDS